MVSIYLGVPIFRETYITCSGNCLFASLSDQLYGTPAKHPEIRLTVLEHMRAFRPEFEHYVHRDDLQQRRALRSASAIARKEPEDAFTEYLIFMSRPGSYGGECELVAFCQAYDQDVTVHLPYIKDYNRDSMFYSNPHRESSSPQPSLHISYGGDEITGGHYNSVRNQNGSHPRSNNSPLLEAQDSRRNSLAGLFSSSPPPSLTARAIRNSRSDLSSELIHDLLQKGKREVEGSLDRLNARARSSSVSSSHRSSSSKRSLEDEGDNPRHRKRADRRKSTRKRIVAVEPDMDPAFRLQIDSPAAGTPVSTQDTEYSSEPAEPEPSEDGDGEYKPVQSIEDPSDSEPLQAGRARKGLKPALRTRAPQRELSTGLGNGITMVERPVQHRS